MATDLTCENEGDEDEIISLPPEPEEMSTFTMNPCNSRNISTQTPLPSEKNTKKTQTTINATSPIFQQIAMRHDKATDTTDLDSHSAQNQEVSSNIEVTMPREIDVESVISSGSEESDDDHAQIQAESSTESEDMCGENEDDSDHERWILQKGKTPQDQVKIVVFEEAILRAFEKCRHCGSKCIVTMESRIGSSCKISASCESGESKHHFVWSTGPLINRMPVFHLLFATGILATGMESAKVLRFFDALKIPNLQQRELSKILKNYVIPAVYNTWHREQSERIKEVVGKSVVVASDMRVDSPGHSGLFGSGSTLDMGRNVILDTQVIKVNISR
jgi:hypothetical protein